MLQESHDPTIARQQVEHFTRNAYLTLEEANPRGFEEIFAEDAFVLSSGSEGGFTTRDAWVSWLTKKFAPGRLKDMNLKVQSNDLRIGLAGGNRSAWVADQIEILGSDSGRSFRLPLRLTFLASHVGTQWRIVSGHWSTHIPNPVAHQLIQEGKLGRSADLGDGATAEAAFLQETYRSAMSDPGSVEHGLSDRPDVIAFGSAVHEVHVGGAALKTAWRDFAAQGPKLTPVGGIRAGVSPDGEMGWAASNLDIGFGSQSMPYRFYLIYLKEPGGWKVVAWHDSYGLDGPA